MNTLIFDSKKYAQNQGYIPFALTDVFTEYTHSNHIEILHFWQLENTFILGMQDTRTPFFYQGLKKVLDSPYQPLVRNSGGLGVIADDGILNVSYFFPKSTDIQTIDQAYEKIKQLLQKALPEIEIAAGEVPNSYCPGAYDLSVAGKKIAGLAQRRIKGGIAVMMYLSVNGPQEQRGEFVREFYQHSLGENSQDLRYPKIDPLSMTTLSTLLEENFTVEQMKQRLCAAFSAEEKTTDLTIWLKEKQLTETLTKKIDQMITRNQIIQEEYHESAL